ncbi:MAG: ATP-binding protein [Pseudomonadota bacterium]
MPRRLNTKWRPPLAFVLGGTLAAVLGLPLIAIVWFRVAGGILGYAETGWLLFWMAVVSTTILGYLLWRLVLRPVRRLTAHAQAVKAGAPDAPPTQFGTPEFRDLGRAVIAMGDSLQTRASSLKAYASHVTHELKSPLTSLRGAVELLEDKALPPEDRAALLATIRAATARMETLLTDLHRTVEDSESAGPGRTDLSDLPENVAGLTLHIARHGAVPLARADLDVVLEHLAQNAAAHGATQLQLEANGAALTVTDNGTGISKGNAARVFDPFFTTRRDSGGTGMGLAIVRMLLGARGGHITLIAAKPASFCIAFD